jgi:hypothetical protein
MKPEQVGLFGSPTPVQKPVAVTANAVAKQEVVPVRPDAEGYDERRLRGALLVAAIAVGRVEGPKLGDDAPLADRCAAFRARLVAFRESLSRSMPPPVLRRERWHGGAR